MLEGNKAKASHISTPNSASLDSIFCSSLRKSSCRHSLSEPSALFIRMMNSSIWFSASKIRFLNSFAQLLTAAELLSTLPSFSKDDPTFWRLVIRRLSPSSRPTKVSTS